MSVGRIKDQVLSGFARVAGVDGPGRGMLSADPQIPEGGDIRSIVSDQMERILDSRQHCRGTWTRKHTYLCSVSPYIAGLSQGTRDTFDVGSTSEPSERRGRCSVLKTVRRPWENDPVADPFDSAQRKPMTYFYLLFAIRYSLFAPFEPS